MIALRKAADRGHANHGWLDTYHTFSFASYHDPKHMGFRSLRVINDDRVEAGQGFGTHPHRDMEILTYILEGELEHRDSMGNGRIIKTGEVQGMSAGTGITHSEFNSSQQPVHLLQIWVMPHTKGVKPSYGEWLPDGSEKTGWALAASEKGVSGSIPIHQDAKMFVATPDEGVTMDISLKEGRFGWIQVGSGDIEVNGEWLKAGDGVAFAAEDVKGLKTITKAKILLFDLA
jgi:quercetin 2,3-dioxygenase